MSGGMPPCKFFFIVKSFFIVKNAANWAIFSFLSGFGGGPWAPWPPPFGAAYGSHKLKKNVFDSWWFFVLISVVLDWSRKGLKSLKSLKFHDPEPVETL